MLFQGGILLSSNDIVFQGVPSLFYHFHPMYIFNYIYKLMSRIIVAHLKPILFERISKE